MKFLFVTLALILVSACASEPSRPVLNFPLQKQILMPRPGYDGKLTYKTCAALGEKGECKVWALSAYDLRDEVVRRTLVKGGFSCLISGDLYRICESDAGFCKQTVKQKCFLGICGKKEITIEKIPIDRYQFLIDAGTVCAAESECDVLSGGC